MIRRIYLASFLLLSGIALQAQISMIRLIHEDKDNKKLKKIEFFDPKTDSIFRTIDVADFNPFNHFSFPQVDINDVNKVWDLNGITAAEVFPDSLFAKRPDWNKIKTYGLVRGTSTTSYEMIGTHRILLYYVFNTHAIEGSLMGMTVLYVFDSEGKELFKRARAEIGIRQVTISKSGRYIAYVTGKVPPDYLPFPKGFRLYDLQQPEFHFFQDAEVPGLHFISDEKLIAIYDTAFADKTHQYRYRIIDVPARKMYSKLYKIEEITEMINMTPKAILFRDGRQEFYDKDFTITDLK